MGAKSSSLGILELPPKTPGEHSSEKRSPL